MAGFFTPQDAEKIKTDLMAASPKNWRDFMAIGLGRTKDAAKAKAQFMAARTIDAPCTTDELTAVLDLIDRRNDIWPQ